MTATTHAAKTLKLIRLFLVGLLLIAWAGLPGALYSAPAATTWYVGGGGNDSNTCTSPAHPCAHVQAAIDKAASGDTIIIAAGVYLEQLSISDKDLTLNGQGAASTILDGDQADIVLDIIRSTVPSVSVNISGVTLQNGRVGQPGGGLAVEANCSVTLSNSIIANNTATSGGGIFNQGTLKLINVTIRANSATEASSQGGGIYNRGSLELSNVLVTDNHAPSGSGGGISNQNTITLTGSSINSNTSGGSGGGIYNAGTNSRLILLNSTIRGNTAASQGGGLFNAASAQIDTAVIMGNTANGVSGAGGGINNMGALTLTQSALVYNAATTQGGGLSNSSSAQLTNVTVSDNTALSGGGIQNSAGTLSLQFDTVSNNSSPSVNNTSGSVTTGNSIFDQATGNACNGTISSAGYNIDRGTSCGFVSSGDYASINPLLGPLQDNGGNSPTRALAFSSAAVDTAGACPLSGVDQRGIARPQPQSPPGTCDRGAYEVVEYGNSNALDIGPNQCVVSTFTSSDKFYIGRLLVGVNLTHPNRPDLTIRLFSPVSSQVGLLGPAANTGQNLDTLFDDSASTVPTGYQNPAVPFYDNTNKPSTPLAKMRGLNIKGTWTLQICNAGALGGTLNRWVLVVPELASFSKIYLPLIRR